MNYGTLKAPGSRILPDEPIYPDSWQNGAPTLEQSESGFANFAVAQSQVRQFDCLRLKPGAMQRAQLEWNGNARAWEGGPIVP